MFRLVQFWNSDILGLSHTHFAKAPEMPGLPTTHGTTLPFGCFHLFLSFTSPTILTAPASPMPRLEWLATLDSTIACLAWGSAFSSLAMWPCRSLARCW